jgi:hypothetical protein
VLGGRTRRELCRVSIRSLSRVLPYDGEYEGQITSFGADRVISTLSRESAPTAYVALWVDSEKTRYALLFEPNEKALRILRYYNMTAVTLRPEDC